VQGFTGAAGNDLDTNNDGILDSRPWAHLVDNVAVKDDDPNDKVYSSVSLHGVFGASRIPNGTDTESAGDWVANDFDGAGFPGVTDTPVYGQAYNTPGATNSLVVQVTDYLLNVATNPADINSTTGGGSYAPGDVVSISAPEDVAIDAGSRYHFDGWTGATVDNSSASSTNLTMPAVDTTVTANYVTQYFLTVNDGGHGTAGGSGWYTAGTNAQATISPLTVDSTADTRYVFAGWSGDAAGSGSPSNNILVDGPKTATATWTAQYKVTFAQSGIGDDT
jgi:uncharacterized repeat protein (TIGR02543 family)